MNGDDDIYVNDLIWVAKIKAIQLLIYLDSCSEALGLDESVVHVDHEDAKHGECDAIDVEHHGEVGLGNLNEHVGALDCLPRFGQLCGLKIDPLAVEYRHLHNVEAALRVIHVLLKLHHALFDTKCNDDLSLRRDNQILNRDDAGFISLIKSHVVLLDLILVSANELSDICFITKEAHPDGEQVQVGPHAVPEKVLRAQFKGFGRVAILQHMEESGVLCELQVRHVSL